MYQNKRRTLQNANEQPAAELQVQVGGAFVTLRAAQVSRASSPDRELADSLLRLVTELACGRGRIEERMKNAFTTSGLMDYPDAEISQDLWGQWQKIKGAFYPDLTGDSAAALASETMNFFFPVSRLRPY